MTTEQLVGDARAIFEAAVANVDVSLLMRRMNWEKILGQADSFAHIRVVGAGKAAMAMAGALEQIPGLKITEGQVVVPPGYVGEYPPLMPKPAQIEVVEGGHPLPDSAGAEAAERALTLAGVSDESDLLLVLLSGGGSALWPAFSEGITMEDARVASAVLINGGADISQINTVRKHLSRISGGRLAQAAFPATVLALVLSDVIGDDFSVIASGPTVPDRTTYQDAVLVLQQFDLWEEVPSSVRARLRFGRDRHISDTPVPRDPVFRRVITMLLGSNRDALRAAAKTAEKLGYQVEIRSNRQQGLAREVGEEMARQVTHAKSGRPLCQLWSGETTVNVTGDGKGGRNQELALAAGIEISRTDLLCVLLSGGTDGRDGPTDAAGAWVTPDMMRRAEESGIDAQAMLENNDAYHFFEATRGLLKTGPTHTNVMDLQIGLTAASHSVSADMR